jgi:hypothetical protein
MKKLKSKTDQIIPGKIAHVIKFCIDENNYTDFPNCAEILREQIQIHLLPVCRVIGYLITSKTIEFLIIPHSESVIRKVPRNARRIHTRLKGGQMMKKYLSGELQIHNVKDESLLCTKGTVHDVVVQKIATVLQCLTLKYNPYMKRTCRLTQRKHTWHEVSKSRIKDVLSMQSALSILQSKKTETKDNLCSAYQDLMRQDSSVIDTAFILRYFKNVIKEIKTTTAVYVKSLGCVITDRVLLRRSSIDWLQVLIL